MRQFQEPTYGSTIANRDYYYQQPMPLMQGIVFVLVLLCSSLKISGNFHFLAESNDYVESFLLEREGVGSFYHFLYDLLN